MDEPLEVKQPRSLLQQRNLPPVVLDQVIVGGKDTPLTALLFQRWKSAKLQALLSVVCPPFGVVALLMFECPVCSGGLDLPFAHVP